MAKIQLFSTAFDEINKDLTQDESYFLRSISSNNWTSKTGIYQLHAVMLASILGFNKFLTGVEISEIEGKFSEIKDSETRQREIMSHKENLSTTRLKNIFDILQCKGKLKYDYKNHLMYIINFHDYVPFGNAKPTIIADEIIRGMSENIDHPFWKDYLQENRLKIKEFITRSEKNAQKSRSPEAILLYPSFLKLKTIIFTNDK